MSNIIPFNYENHPMRVFAKDGENWWVASDVCDILELSNPRSSMALLDNDEKGVHTVDTLGGKQSVACVNEPGLYTLILKSRRPEAKAFKRWITHDVIPSIRKTGVYSAHPLQGVSMGLGDVIEDPKLLTKYIHHLKGLQEVLYPKHIQEVPTQPEKLKNDILRVLASHPKPMTAAAMHGSWIKNTETETIREACEEMAGAGLLMKTVSNSAKQGKYSLA